MTVQSTPLAVKLAVDQTFSGALLQTRPYWALADEITQTKIPDFPMNVMNISIQDTSGVAQNNTGYTINYKTSVPDYGVSDGTKFGVLSSAEGMPSIIRSHKFYCFAESNEEKISGYQANFLSLYSSKATTDVSDFQTNFPSVFADGRDIISTNGELARCASGFAGKVLRKCSDEFFLHANLVFDLTASQKYYANDIVYAIQKCVTDTTNYRGVQSLARRISITAPDFVQPMLQFGLNQLPSLNNQSKSNIDLFSPAEAQLLRASRLFTSGDVMIIPDSLSSLHVAGDAAALDDLTIKTNPFGANSSAWYTQNNLSKSFSTITLTSATKDVYTLKAGDVIAVTGKFRAKMMDRSLAVLTTGPNVYSTAPLHLIVQKDATAVAKDITVEIVPEWIGYTVYPGDFAAATPVVVTGDHWKLGVVFNEGLYKAMWHKSMVKAGILFMPINDVMSSYLTPTGGNFGITRNATLAMETSQSSSTPRDYETRMQILAYYTYAVMPHVHCQICLPATLPTADAYNSLLYVKNIT